MMIVPKKPLFLTFILFFDLLQGIIQGFKIGHSLVCFFVFRNFPGWAGGLQVPDSRLYGNVDVQTVRV